MGLLNVFRKVFWIRVDLKLFVTILHRSVIHNRSNVFNQSEKFARTIFRCRSSKSIPLPAICHYLKTPVSLTECIENTYIIPKDGIISLGTNNTLTFQIKLIWCTKIEVKSAMYKLNCTKLKTGIAYSREHTHNLQKCSFTPIPIDVIPNSSYGHSQVAERIFMATDRW
jgi:hypothetical protein